jgi:hypothetical protein
MAEPTVDEYMAMNEDDLEDEVRDMPVTDSCDAVR